MAEEQKKKLEDELKSLGSKLEAEDQVMSAEKESELKSQVMRSIGRWDMVEALEEEEDHGWFEEALGDKVSLPKIRFSLPATIVSVTLAFLLTLTTSAVAQNSKPGDPLFGVKKTFENIQVMMANTPQQQAELRLKFADQRLNQLDYSNPQPQNLSQALDETQVAVSQAAKEIQEIENPDEAKEYLDRLENLLATQEQLAGGGDNNNENTQFAEHLAMLNQTLEERIKEAQQETPLEEEGEESSEESENENSEETDESEDSEETLASLDTDQTATLTATPTADLEEDPNQEPVRSDESAPRAQLTGNLITSYGQPALIVDNTYYLINNPTTVDLNQHIGESNVRITGSLDEGTITATEIVINSRVYEAEDTDRPETDTNEDSKSQSSQDESETEDSAPADESQANSTTSDEISSNNGNDSDGR